jgi:hypothetical protein
MEQLSPRDLLTAAMTAALRSEPYEAERCLDDYAMLRGHGAAEPTITIQWEKAPFTRAGDHFARYVRSILKLDADHKIEPENTIVIEKPKCDCLAHRDCIEHAGNPKNGIPYSRFGSTEFRYSDMSSRHWNHHAGGWIASCRWRCPAFVALLAKSGFRLPVA